MLELPDDLSLALLDILALAEQGKPWPESMMVGLIHSLQKHEDSSKVSDFRPITICSVIYRCWASIRSRQVLRHFLQQADDDVCGNLPGRSTKDVWLSIQLQLEDGYAHQQPTGGCVLDLVKAFNTLPRLPILAACSHFGAPPEIIRGWNASLRQLQRRFVIRGGTGPPVRSCTGFAEGCSLSVVGMLAVNMMTTVWMRKVASSARVLSYVDNIELLSKQPDLLQADFRAIKFFFDRMDLSIDPVKTYFWATDSESRSSLADAGLRLEPWARDLGAHVQYSKQATNAVLTTKIERYKPQWKQLARSHAPVKQKLRALKVAAWPNILHGIASAHLGTHHFDEMRTQAIRCLMDQSPGTSPLALFSLCVHPSADPGFFAVWDTVQDLRTHANLDFCHPILDQACQPSTRVRPAPGPCQVLLHRLQLLGWHWDPAGFFRDQWNAPIDLWSCNSQELHLRMTEAWQARQCGHLSHRKTFQALERVHAKFSVEALPPDPLKRSILTRCLDGIFFTANHLRHRAVPQSTICIFCQGQDSAYHRHWECPVLEIARKACPPDVRKLVPDLPLSASCHGWFEAPPEFTAFRNILQAYPDTTWQWTYPGFLPPLLDLFTDGSCLCPQDSFGRLSSWGVVLYDVDKQVFTPVAADLVPGLIQTVPRAEYFAVLGALRFAVSVRRPFRLWVDNQQVCTFLQAVLAGEVPRCAKNTPNHDLRLQILDLLVGVRHHCRGVFKVCSHQDLDLLDDEAEVWACTGNQAADAEANHVFSQHPSVLDAWFSLQTALQNQRRIRDEVHKTLLAVGEFVLHRSQTIASCDADPDEPRQDIQSQPLAMTSWEFPAQLPASATAFLITDWPRICNWIASLHQEGDIHFLCWTQLYVDYMLRYQSRGPWYQIKTLRWWSADSMPASVHFTKRCRWFGTFLNKLAKHASCEPPSNSSLNSILAKLFASSPSSTASPADR